VLACTSVLGTVWRVRRTLAGDVLGASWVDVSEDHQRAPRVLVGRLFARQAWEREPGLECVPSCDRCGSVMVWLGHWQCAGCAVRGGFDGDGVATPNALPREALAGAPFLSSSEGNNSTARSGWLASVEALTSFHRRKVAAGLRWRRKPDVTWVNWETGELVPGRVRTSRWHEQRELGQVERFDRVRACGTYEYALDVTGLDGKLESRPIRQRCDCWRVCPRCSARRRWKLRDGMTRQREAIKRRFWRQTGRYYRGTEGTWSEKLITFTVPHGALGPAADARVLVDAWQKLLRLVRRHLVQRGAVVPASVVGGPPSKPVALPVPWNRALEVAAGNGDPNGHAHMHVWWYGPFLDVALLQLWWGKLLVDAGVPGVVHVPWSTIARSGKDARLWEWAGKPALDAVLPRGIVDIRSEKKDSAALAEYTQKVGVALYVTKGSESYALAPVHAASIYEVFEGTRAVQWARGWAPPKVPVRALCVSFRRLTDEEKRLLNHSRITPQKEAKNDAKTEEKASPLDLPPTSRAPPLQSVFAPALPVS
jgi:hypothetical protein